MHLFPIKNFLHKQEELVVVNRTIMALPLGAIQLAVVSFVTLTLAIVATILRIWSKYLQNHSLAIHDYLAVAGMFFTAATVAVYVTGELLQHTPLSIGSHT